MGRELFNLMVMGMLYNDSFRIRPELRGLLRFGSYHRLEFEAELMFTDEAVWEYLEEGTRDPHHPLAPFKFYTKQIEKWRATRQRVNGRDGLEWRAKEKRTPARQRVRDRG